MAIKRYLKQKLREIKPCCHFHALSLNIKIKRKKEINSLILDACNIHFVSFNWAQWISKVDFLKIKKFLKFILQTSSKD